MEDPLRILVVDDSSLTRLLLRDLLMSDPGVCIVGEAANGYEAIARVAELGPDLVILDVRMPVMDGVETTRQIMAYRPTPILALTACLNSFEGDIGVELLRAGALEVMEKPRLGSPASLDEARRALLRKVHLLARIKVVTHLRGRRCNRAGAGAGAEAPATASSAIGLFPVVVIGASTGGPRAVRRILAGLPARFPAAVLVVQHIAQGFSPGLVGWLAEDSQLPVALAQEGLALSPGRVLVAPDHLDLLVQPAGTIHLSDQPLLLQRPAIDIAMQSVAAIAGAAATGVLLTGMGRDGALGMLAIRRAGGMTIAQDEASSVVFSMPRAAIKLGAADLVLTPATIAVTLAERTKALV